MKKLLTLLTLFFTLSTPLFAETQLLDRVIAVVNEEAITQSELDVIMRPIYEKFKEDFQGEELIQNLNDARHKLLNQLIEDRLVYQEAKKQNIEVDETEVEEMINEFKQKFESEKALEEALRKEGITLTVMREKFKQQSMIRQLQDQEIRSKVVVSPKEIEAYYAEHPSEFSEAEKIRIRSITLKKSEEARQKGLTDEAAKNKLVELRKRILSGEDFGELAKEYSEDTHAANSGLGEFIEKGNMIPVIDEVIFSMKTGEISEIIETPMGYHLFRVEERTEGYKKTFDEVRDQIFAKLFYSKGNERFREWMDDLKRNAYISIR